MTVRILMNLLLLNQNSAKNICRTTTNLTQVPTVTAFCWRLSCDWHIYQAFLTKRGQKKFFFNYISLTKTFFPQSEQVQCDPYQLQLLPLFIIFL